MNVKGGAYTAAVAAAAAKGRIEIVRALLGGGASVNEPYNWKSWVSVSIPFSFAVCNGDLPICEVLMEHDAVDFGTMKAKLPRALHAAVRSCRVDIIKALLKQEQIQAAKPFSKESVSL